MSCKERELLAQVAIVYITTNLFHERVRLSSFLTITVARHAILVQVERQAQTADAKSTVLKPTGEELLREALNKVLFEC